MITDDKEDGKIEEIPILTKEFFANTKQINMEIFESFNAIKLEIVKNAKNTINNPKEK